MADDFVACCFRPFYFNRLIARFFEKYDLEKQVISLPNKRQKWLGSSRNMTSRLRARLRGRWWMMCQS